MKRSLLSQSMRPRSEPGRAVARAVACGRFPIAGWTGGRQWRCVGTARLHKKRFKNAAELSRRFQGRSGSAADGRLLGRRGAVAAGAMADRGGAQRTGNGIHRHAALLMLVVLDHQRQGDVVAFLIWPGRSSSMM